MIGVPTYVAMIRMLEIIVKCCNTEAARGTYVSCLLKKQPLNHFVIFSIFILPTFLTEDY